MTDRELLELAAKACGYDTSHHWNAERLTLTPPVIGLCIKGGSTCWNPLQDDGDALRLASALSLHIEWRLDGRVAVSPQDQVEEIYCMESSREDRHEGVRRAIVRAAAAIGRAMP